MAASVIILAKNCTTATQALTKQPFNKTAECERHESELILATAINCSSTLQVSNASKFDSN